MSNVHQQNTKFVSSGGPLVLIQNMLRRQWQSDCPIGILGVECIARSNGALKILNLNSGRLNAKFDNLKIFLAECNNTIFPLHVITLQETHINLIQIFAISICPVTLWFMI